MTGRRRPYIGKTAMERGQRSVNGSGRGVTVSVLRKKPEIIVFAGLNGSGKSTFTELLKPPIDYINADEIKKFEVL